MNNVDQIEHSRHKIGNYHEDIFQLQKFEECSIDGLNQIDDMPINHYILYTHKLTDKLKQDRKPFLKYSMRFIEINHTIVASDNTPSQDEVLTN